MKIFTSKSIRKKIIIAILMVLSFQFILSSPVRADSEGFGGKLLEPVLSLVIAIGDGAVGLIHENVMGQDQSLVRVDLSTTTWDKIGAIVVGVAAGILTIAAIIVTCGAAVFALAAVGITASVSIGVGTIITGVVTGIAVGVWYDNTCLPQDLVLPMYSISAEEIFQGKILLFDVDFFNPETDIYLKTNEGKDYKLSDYKNKQDKLDEIISDEKVQYYYYKDGNDEVKTSKQNTAYEIQKVISKWYNALRNIALVLMMSVLLYVAIRMMLSSIASDKAKYKQMLMDWLVGICLLFFLHYIMAFSVAMVKQLTKVIDSGFDEENNTYAVVMQDDEAEKLSDKLKEMGMEDFVQENDNGDKYISWPTSLMGKVRLQAQLTMGTEQFIGYAICFIVLVFYTVFFAFTYLKRVIYLAFLTLIAPFVALTYPIDKLNDGQAQGFNKWLKEYLFNLLIQPLHLLLYTILVSSVFEFAGLNTIYMLVAIGFLLPAEKLLRSLFGFEKASTPGSFAGAAAGAGLVASGMQKLLRKAPDGGPNKKKLGKDNVGKLDSGSDGPGIRVSDNEGFDEIDEMAGMAGMAGAAAGAAGAAETAGAGDAGNAPGARGTGGSETAGEPAGATNTNGNGNNTNGENPQTDRELNNGDDPNGTSRVDQGTATQASRRLTRPSSNSNGKANKAPRFKRTRAIFGGVGRAAKVGGRRLVAKGGLKLTEMAPKLPGKALRFAGAAMLAGTAATLGVAAGVATGDAKNAVQYGAMGLGAGAVAGRNLSRYTERKIDDVKNSATVSAMRQAYYGDEKYKEIQHKEQVEKWTQNMENREYLERELGMKATKEMFKEGKNGKSEIQEYLDNGISDVKSIATMHKLQEDGVAKNTKQAMTIHQYAERTGDTTKMNEDNQGKWRKTFEKEFKGRGHSDDQSSKMSENTFDMINKYNKVKNKM